MPTFEQYMSAADNAEKAGAAGEAIQLRQMAQSVRAQSGSSRGGGVSVGEDIARTAPGALRRGMVEGIGGFGDAQKMTSDAVKWAGSGMGVPDAITSGAAAITRNFPFPGAMTTKEIDKQKTPGGVFDYEPQTKAGEVVGEGLEWTAGALPGGAPGMLRRGVSGLVGGAASELAGQATEGTGFENAARIGAGIFSSTLPTLAEGVVRSAAPSKYDKFRRGVGSKEEMRQGAKDTYKELRRTGMTLDGMKARRFHLGLINMLNEGKFRQSGATQTTGIVAAIGDEVAKGKFDYGDMVAYRKRLKDTARSAVGVEKGAAGEAVGALDDFMGNLTVNDFTVGSLTPQAAHAKLKAADNAYRRAAISQDIESIIETAKATAGTNYVDAGVHTALKRGIKNYASRKSTSKFLKPEERQEFLRLSSGTDATEMLKVLSRFRSPLTAGSLALGVSGAVGSAAGDPLTALQMGGAAQLPATAGLMGAGSLAKAAAERDIRRKMQSLDLFVRSGKITPEQRADTVRRILREASGAGMRGAYTGVSDEWEEESP